MKIDLESGKQTLWSTGDFLANRYSKLSETALLVDSYQPGGLKTRSWLFDVEKSTLAPVEGEVGQIGILANLDGRTGFMRRGNRIWFGDELEAGEPVPLEKVLSSFNLERQLAKIEAETRALESANGIGSYDPRTSRITNSTPSIGLNPLIAGVANQAQIEAIGVYQGGKVAEATIIDGRKAGEVVVQIHRSAKPIVLVLSSYEPVKWTLRAESGTKLAAVLLSGYYRSEVVGAGSARVFSVGRTYAYKLDSAEYNKLNLETTRLTGKGIGVFQGRYEGGSFSIGG